MKKTFIFLMFISLISCSQTKKQVIENIESNYNNFLVRQNTATRFINNEGQFINKSRKEFLSKLNINFNSNFDIIELYDMFHPKTYYTSAIKIESEVYYFERGFNNKSKLKTYQFENFKKEYPLIACLLLEAESNIDKLTGSKVGDSTFHFSIHIIKRLNGKTTNYSSMNICTLNNNKVEY